MADPVECTFTSEWDGGVLVTTPATVDPDTGKLVSIEVSDDEVEGLDHLDREYLTLPDGSDHAVAAGEDGRYGVTDLDAFQAALQGAPRP